MKVLVTGSSGRLGRSVVELLRSKNIQCIGMDLLPSDTTDVLADIRDKNDILKITKGVGHVIHTAAVHGRHMDMNMPRSEFVETNIMGTLNLLEESVEAGVKSFIYTSSTSVYGKSMEDTSSAVWVDEELPAIPRDIYDITKLAGENLCKDFFEKEGLNGCVLRVSRFMEEPENSIANYRLYRGLDERDGALAHWLALHKRFKSFEIFNISNETPFTKADLIDLKTDPRKVILRYYPKCEEIYNKRQWTFPQSIDRVYAIDKAKRMLDYRPVNNFMEYVSGLSV